eukprot:534777-Pleurochrysis_carterae.AAC.1
MKARSSAAAAMASKWTNQGYDGELEAPRFVLEPEARQQCRGEQLHDSGRPTGGLTVNFIGRQPAGEQDFEQSERIMHVTSLMAI